LPPQLVPVTDFLYGRGSSLPGLRPWAKQASPGFFEGKVLKTDSAQGSNNPHAILSGRTVGHYQILSELGQGGMGKVYQARDSLLGRTVALKVLPPELVNDQERKRRLLREAKAASALNHPNIVVVYDILNEDGIDFVVMEYVEGQTLAQLLSGRKLSLDETLKYAIQVCSALASAHAAGVVHRDLKPGNIMVNGQGVVKVLDFGLAKRITTGLVGSGTDGTSTETLGTEAGMIVGTVSYMSPEQAEGKPVDARSDIFSLGTLLYELLTGRQPFQADSHLATLTAILREDPKPPSQLVRGIPKELDPVLERCLRKDQERRFQSAADLRVVLQDLHEQLRREKPGVIAAPPARRWLWAGVAAAALAGLGMALWLARSPEPGAPSSFRIVPLTSYPGMELYPSFSPDGRQVAFSWNGENQDNFDIYIKQVGTESRLRLTSHPGRDFSPSWSPDGRWIAFLRQDNDFKFAAFIISTVGGRERRLGEFRRPQLGMPWPTLAWSPDSQWLAVPDQPTGQGPHGLFLVSVETGEKRRLTSCPTLNLADYAPAFSPDGQSLAFARFIAAAVSDLYLLALSRELSPTAEPTRLTFENRHSTYPAWTTDGSELVFVSGGQHHYGLWKVPVSGRTRPEPLPLGGGGVHLVSPALSRQGDLAFVQRIFDPNIWRIQISRSDHKAGSAAAFISSSFVDHFPQFSPDGQKIAFASYRSGHSEIWVCDGDGSNAFQLTSFSGEDSTGPCWSPDGRQIAFAANQEGQVELYVIGAEGGKARRLTIHPAADRAPSWSRDGKWIYFDSNRTGQRQVWKMPAQRGDAVQVTKNGGSIPIESPDGLHTYFLKPEEPVSSLWRISADGVETQVLDSVFAVNYAVVKDGIYFIPASREERFAIDFLSFSKGMRSQLASITKPVQWGFSVSPDERWILYTQTDHLASDLMLVENFLGSRQ
jgi:eukaryotic-like serine/threonine-protein kinase